MKKSFMILLITIFLSSCVKIDFNQEIKIDDYSKVKIEYDFTELNEGGLEENNGDLCEDNNINSNEKISGNENIKDYKCEVVDKNNFYQEFSYKIPNKYIEKNIGGNYGLNLLYLDELVINPNSLKKESKEKESDTIVDMSEISSEDYEKVGIEIKYNLIFPEKIVHNKIGEKNGKKLIIAFIDWRENKDSLILFGDKEINIDYELKSEKYYKKELIVSNRKISSKNKKYINTISEIEYNKLSIPKLISFKYNINILKKKVNNLSDFSNIINMLDAKISLEIIDKKSEKNKNIIIENGKLLIKNGAMTGKFDIPDDMDIESIEDLGNQYIKDKNNLYKYIFGRDLILVEGLDSSTYEYINDDFIKDKNNIYQYFGFKFRKAEEVDVNSFEIMNDEFVKDKNNVYSKGLSDLDKIEGAVPSTFEVLNDNFAKDENNVYYENDYSRIKKIEGIDINTFEIINYRFAKDKNNVYNSELEIIEEADTETFEGTSNSYFAKDKNYVYNFEGEIIEEADTETFEGTSDSYYAKDKNNVYSIRGGIVEGEDPKTFQP